MNYHKQLANARPSVPGTLALAPDKTVKVIEIYKVHQRRKEGEMAPHGQFHLNTIGEGNRPLGGGIHLETRHNIGVSSLTVPEFFHDSAVIVLVHGAYPWYLLHHIRIIHTHIVNASVGSCNRSIFPKLVHK